MSAEKGKKHKTSKSRSDTAVQGTNDSSIVSKCSMAAQGYFDDPFLKNFVIKVTRRAPLIHRGYYMRAKALDFLVKKFLHSHKGPKQIISLGAGFDSAYFRLTSQDLLGDTVYCEVDFPDVVRRKNSLIKMNDVLSQMIGEPLDGKEKSPAIELWCKNYRLLGVDLTQLRTLEATLKLCDVDFGVPTLLLSEIVLTYMHRRCASSVIRWAAHTFSDSVFVMYEQINPDDAFGLFMQKHYNVIGSPLKCINTFPTMQSQMDRFKTLGWTACEAVDMNTFYQDLVSGKEKDRVENLEPFDEYEDYNLKCCHYMMLCAYNGRDPYLLSHIPNHSEHACDKGDIPVYENCIKLTSVKTKMSFCRFGHMTINLGCDWLISLGGFGEQEGKHMRATYFTFTNLSTLQTVNVDPKINNKETEVSRMHATASYLQDGTILLIGGRLSPMKLCTQMVALKLNCGIADLENILQCSETLQNDTMTETHNFEHCKGRQKRKVTKDKNNSSEEIKCELSVKTGSDKSGRQKQHEEGADDKKVTEEQDNTKTGENDDPCVCRQNAESFPSSQGASIANMNGVQAADGQSRQLEDNSSGDQGNNSDKTSFYAYTNKNMKNKKTVIDFPVNCCIVDQNGELPCPRWRHTALVVNVNGKEKIILFGGRTQDVLALGDCFSYDTETKIWTKIHHSGNPPSPRHSHTVSLWNGHMIIAGGLGDDQKPLDCVYMLNLETLVWHKLDCKMPSRYSHTASIVRDHLVLIGGVSFSHRPPGVSVIHLPTGQCVEFSLPTAHKEDLVMLHCHTSVAIDNNRLLFLGGGGNCFSFGTHLNSSPIIMDLTEIFQIADAKLNGC